MHRRTFVADAVPCERFDHSEVDRCIRRNHDSSRRKPFDEIMEMLKDYKKVLNVGCATCVSVCLAGGEKEVDVLNAELDMARNWLTTPSRSTGSPSNASATGNTWNCWTSGERNTMPSCPWPAASGIQFLAERFPDTPVFPGVDTSGLAVNQAVGWYEERCRSCQSCVLGMDRRYLPGDHVRQGPLQRPLRRHQQRKMRNQSGSGLCLVQDLRAAVGPGTAGQHQENLRHQVDWKDTTPRTLIQPGYKKPEKVE
jgi:ferredoxin